MAPFKEARQAAGLTQVALAEKAFVNPRIIGQCDRGYIPSRVVRGSLARALNTTEDELWPLWPLGRALEEPVDA